MMRAGSTVQYQLTKAIVEAIGAGQGLGWLDVGSFPQRYQQYHGSEQMYVVKVHDFVPEAQRLIDADEARAIYVYRDVRDVVVSIMNKRNKSFWHIVLLNPYLDLVIEQYRAWTGLDNILISQYEQMALDLRAETERIADYLGIKLDEQIVTQIAAEYSVRHQKQRIENKQIVKTNPEKGHLEGAGATAVLHANHIHSGKPEQWKTALSPSQIAFVEAAAGDILAARNYPLSGARMRPATVAGVLLAKRILFPAKRWLVRIRNRVTAPA